MAANRVKGITVEIGGDTTKLQTALKGVNGEIRTTQSQLKDVDKLLKLDPGNTELLAQKHRLLGDAVAETKEKLATLKMAAEQANTALASGEISQAQYDGLQREIIETEQALRSLEQQAGQSSVAVQKIAAVGETIKSAGEKISDAGEKMLPATAAVTGLGAAAVTTAAGFDTSMSQVQATMGITKDSMSEVDGQSVNTMDTLRELAKEMGASTAFSAKECADALNYLALAGYDTQEMCSTLPTVLNLAAAGDIELAEASDMVTDAMSALGLGTQEADLMVDQMAKTASTTNTSVAQLGSGMLKIGATAKNMKGGTAELCTALGILANNGIKAAEGGTHLRNIMLSLQNPRNSDAGEYFEILGLHVYDAAGNMRSMNEILCDLNAALDGKTMEQKNSIIKTIFNKTDIAAVNALLANTGDTWEELQQNIIDSGGAAQQMADTQLDNLEGQLTILQSALEGLAISFGELLMPAIQQIVGWVQAFVDKLNGLDEGTKKNIVTIGLIAAAIGPVLIIIGKVVSAVGTIMTIIPKLAGVIHAVKGAFAALNATMLANPIFLVIAAITALVAAFIYLWNTNEDFRQFWIDLWNSIQEVAAAAWTAIQEFFTTAWETISETAKTVWNGIKEFFSTLWEGIKNIFTTIVTAIQTFLTTAWNAIKTVITTVMNAIKTVFTTVWNAIKTVITTVVNVIKTVITTVMNGIKGMITTTLKAIKAVVTTVWNAIKTIITTITTAIQIFLTTAWTAIKTVLTTVLNAIKTIVTTVWNAIKDVITTVVNGIKTTISTVWNQIKTTISSTVNGIKNTVGTAFKTMWNGIKTTINGIYHTIKDGFNKAVDFIKGLASSAFNWGADIINGIVNGIKSCIGNIADAVSNVAETIQSYLHFSVPDVGPLTDYESWMPDFMQGLAKGIEQSRGMVEKAVKGVASDMMINPAVSSASVEISKSTAGTGMGSTESYGYGSSPLITIQEMTVRSEDDIRRVSQELNTLLQAGRRARGMG